MRPKIQQKLEFMNCCGCVCDYNELEKAMLWYSSGTLMRNRKIFMHGRYPGVSLYDKKIHVHRLIKSFQLGRELRTDEHIHHIDNNPLNNTIGNLLLTNCRDHIRSHLKGKRQNEDQAIVRTSMSCFSQHGHHTKKYIEKYGDTTK